MPYDAQQYVFQNKGIQTAGQGPGVGFNAYPGLGMGIQTYGYQNPYGPFLGLPRADGTGGTSNSTSTTPGGQNSAALKYLEGTLSGQNTPYNEQTRNAMYAQASGMNAAAEGAQNRQLQESIAMGGASPTDPSAQNAMRQSMAQRQGANQQAMGDINRTANIANERFRMDAAGQLMAHDAAIRSENRAATNSALNYLYGGGGSSPRSDANSAGFLSLPYGRRI